MSMWTLRAVDLRQWKERSINRKWRNERQTQFDHIVEKCIDLEKTACEKIRFSKLFSKHRMKTNAIRSFVLDIVYFHNWWNSLHDIEICSTIYFSSSRTYYIKKRSTPQLFSICLSFSSSLTPNAYHTNVRLVFPIVPVKLIRRNDH